MTRVSQLATLTPIRCGVGGHASRGRSESSVSRFTFDCPECSAEVDVDDDIRAEILDNGCVLCRAQVGPSAFSRIGSNTMQ
ncbi:DUF7560 family zinc ribbon protein [Halostella pelagica]